MDSLFFIGYHDRLERVRAGSCSYCEGICSLYVGCYNACAGSHSYNVGSCNRSSGSCVPYSDCCSSMSTKNSKLPRPTRQKKYLFQLPHSTQHVSITSLHLVNLLLIYVDPRVQTPFKNGFCIFSVAIEAGSKE